MLNILRWGGEGVCLNCHSRRYESGCFDVLQWPTNMPRLFLFPRTSLCASSPILYFYMAVPNLQPSPVFFSPFLFSPHLHPYRTDNKQSPVCQFGTHPRLAVSRISKPSFVSSSPKPHERAQKCGHGSNIICRFFLDISRTAGVGMTRRCDAMWSNSGGADRWCFVNAAAVDVRTIRHPELQQRDTDHIQYRNTHTPTQPGEIFQEPGSRIKMP